MAESVKQRLNLAGFSPRQQRELYALFESLRIDVTTLGTKAAAVHAKLDADAGVTDTNYGTTGTFVPNTQP